MHKNFCSKAFITCAHADSLITTGAELRGVRVTITPRPVVLQLPAAKLAAAVMGCASIANIKGVWG